MLSTKKTFYILLPALFIVVTAFFIQIIRYKPLFPKIEDKIDTSKFIIPLYQEDPIIGNSKSPKTIVAFEDFACSGCLQQNTYLDNLQKKYPDKFKIIWKGLPITTYPYDSNLSQTYSYCANQQKKFEEFRQYAFANNNNLSETILKSLTKEIKLDENKLEKCINSEDIKIYIEKTKQIAQILNIQSLPAFFIDNKQIQTPSSEYEWEELLELNQ